MVTRTAFLLIVISVLALAQSKPRIILVVGPPAAGKTTQSEYIAKTWGLTRISADHLIQENRQEFARARTGQAAATEPRLDPALNRVMETAIDALPAGAGAVIDGYPNTVQQAEHFAALSRRKGLPAITVIHLRIPDDVVRKRYAAQNPALLEQQLKDYHREMDMIRTYFPNADIQDVDGSLKPAGVSKQIRKILGGPKTQGLRR